MEKLLKILIEELEVLGMEINVKKTEYLEVKPENEQPITISTTKGEIIGDILFSLEYKYLGVDIFVKNRMSIFKLKHKAMIQKGKSMAKTIKGMAARSFDPAWVATELWFKMAVPTILYACEITEISPTVMTTIEGLHGQMAAFVLGVNGNCSHAGALQELGWSSISKLMFQRKLKYFHRLCKMEDSYLAKSVLNDCFRQFNDVGLPRKVSYKNEIEKIITTCKLPMINEATIWKKILPLIVKWDNNEITNRVYSKTTHSLKWLPMKFLDNGKQSYIDGSAEARIISQFRLGQGQLDNREGSTLIKCTLCQQNTQVTEAHIIMSCTSLTELRKECGLMDWCQRNNLLNATEDKKLRLYLGDDGIIGSLLKERGKVLIKMREKYLSKRQEQFDRGMNSLNETDLRLRANYDFNAQNPINGEDHSIWNSWANITNIPD